MAEINTWPGWECVRQLGAGSFGKVYEIERTDSGKTYKAALKVITIPQNDSEIENAYSTGMDEEAVTQYFRSFVTDVMNEIALMADLKGYTNIVSYEDHMMVEHEGKIGWDILIRMELLTPLQKWAAEHPLNESDVIKLGCDMCRALELCHKSKIIHRDIKPQNIFVNKNGDFKLGDFGIARVVEKTNSVMSQKGTYTYMAPEVFQGRNYNETADIYSLGIVLYRFLNHNRTPFLPMGNINYHDQQAAQDRRMSGETVPEPALGSSKLKQAVVMTLQYEPEKRVQSAIVLNRILEQCKSAVKMSDSEGLQNLKTSAISNIPTDIAASMQPKMELEGTLPVQPKVVLEGTAPVQPKVNLEGTAPVQPKVNLEGTAPVQPKVNLEGNIPVQPKTDFSGIASGWSNEDMEATSAAPVVDAEATTRVGANRTGAGTALNRSQKKKKPWIIGIVATVLLLLAIVGAIAEKSAQEKVNSRLETSEALTETNQPSGTESDGLIPEDSSGSFETPENETEENNGASMEIEGELRAVCPTKVILVGDSVMISVATDNFLFDNSSKGLEFYSTNSSIATINSNGIVTGVAPGYANLTVEYEGQEASCRVYVALQPDNRYTQIVPEYERISVHPYEDVTVNLTLDGNLQDNFGASCYCSGNLRVNFTWGELQGNVLPLTVCALNESDQDGIVTVVVYPQDDPTAISSAAKFKIKSN